MIIHDHLADRNPEIILCKYLDLFERAYTCLKCLGQTPVQK